MLYVRNGVQIELFLYVLTECNLVEDFATAIDVAVTVRVNYWGKVLQTRICARQQKVNSRLFPDSSV